MAHIKVSRRSMSNEQWARVNFNQLNQFIIKQRYSIPNWHIRTGEYHPDAYTWDHDEFIPIIDGERWGGPDVTSVFKTTVIIPPELEGQKLYFEMVTPTEVMVKVNGSYMNGLDPNRSSFPFVESANPGDIYEIILEAYTRSKPDDDRNVATRQLKGCIQNFKSPSFMVLDEDMLEFKYDLDMLYSLAYSQHVEDHIKENMEHHINEVLHLLPLFESSREEYTVCMPIVKQYFNDHIYNQFHTYSKQGNLALVAHSHLDIAYHWTAKQTVQKNARTCLIQLRLMDRHPEFKYSHTQAWTYEMLEKYYPDIFEEVKKRVADGRWEIVGAMYVEPDCNLISAESHVRQLLYGKKYFKETFNVEVNNCWLPDVFGNSAIMPQILKKSGVDYFVSNKMSTWNDTNMFPYNNFIWKGLDGSTVNASVPPVHFITWLEPDQAIENWDAYKEKEIYPESLQMYGYGDGGSGVTDAMIAYIERQEKLPGIPHQRITTGKEYLESAFSHKEKDYPVWDGDLYLEMHRGTFTTKGDLKRINRKSEFLAQEIETLATLSYLRGNDSWQEALEAPWKKLLTNQFHDILPGSHTTPVATEALELYDVMEKEFNSIKEGTLNQMLTSSSEGNFVVLNPSIQEKKGIANLNNTAESDYTGLKDSHGNTYPLQIQQQPDGKTRICAQLPFIKGLGSMSLTGLKTFIPENTSMKISQESMENKYYRIEINTQGEIINIYDKIRFRNVIREGETVNQWALYDDRPGKYNAWDILKNYEEYPIALPHWKNIQVVEDGPISIALRMERKFSNSKACQIIRLYAEHPRIDFETWVDWQEDQKLLKVLFPVDVYARVYDVDTSAGVLQRYNNQNTTWEQARFEVPCHKWVGMSEGIFGVSILNDCKYGCHVEDNIIGLSLLRAPIRPDRDSDRKEHYFTYSLMTHGGQWQNDGLVEEAYALNWPLQVYPNKKTKEDFEAPLSLDTKALQCQAFKLSEDGTKDIILRLVETYSSKGIAKIKLNFPVKEAWLCNLIEETQQSLTLEHGMIQVPYEPNEIISIRLKSM
ncbi:alpha-mannosidase [Vallitalea okinawensis]|uniref:alpha-mannosidase n=1 Tax=Vallitalea okinawensis TaxID=2078660 RepID=UPI000CFA9E2E|nr:glycoside hydrolase family 38 C-terminal domain-containing protein [Vallitalea okinawensis]